MNSVSRYRKNKCKQLQITLFPKDKDIIEFLDGMEGKAAYVRALIREDMKRRGYYDRW